jgi:hypothetical protein
MAGYTETMAVRQKYYDEMDANRLDVILTPGSLFPAPLKVTEKLDEPTDQDLIKAITYIIRVPKEN